MADESHEGGLEHFQPTGGRVAGVLGLVVAASFVVAWAFGAGSVASPVAAVGLVAGVLAWAALLRPRVSASSETLVLRNMLETVHVPLAAVDEIVVRQVLAVRVADKKFVSPAVGRKLRKVMGAPRPPQLLGPDISGSVVDELASPADTPLHLTSVDYADFVESRLRELVERARLRHGVRRYSDEAAALAADVRREPAWPEIVGLVAAIGAFVLTLLV